MNDEDHDMRNAVRRGYQEGDYYALYGRRNLPKKWQTSLLKQFAALLPSHASVLDWGAGNGDPYDRWLLAQGFQVTAVEFCRKHLDEGLKHFPAITWIRADFSRFPWPDAAYDGLVMLYSLLHIPREEQAALFATAARTLRPGGAILLTINEHASDQNLDWEAAWADGPGMAFSHYDAATSLASLEAAGFTLRTQTDEQQHGGENFRWLLLQKP